MSILNVAEKVYEVYRSKYGEAIEIEAKDEDNKAETTKPFKYSVEKPIQTGFKFEGNMEIEIEKTMDVYEEFLK